MNMTAMEKIWRSMIRLKMWKDERGQDLVEYAMIGGFIAVVAGMFMPNISQDISTVFSKVASGMTRAASTS